jgi:hypothetical protein
VERGSGIAAPYGTDHRYDHAVSVRDVPARFAVAFSLAGEHRHLILPVVQELEDVLGRSSVFYDEWYEHWIAGSDADLLLQDLYAARCDLVVFCVSDVYGNKPWTQVEHRAIRARLQQAEDTARAAVLPVRVGDGDVPGVLVNNIVPDLRGKTAAEAASLIIGRLNHSRKCVAEMTWPEQPPALKWPMVDHEAARDSFAQILSRGSATQALFIRGESELGKSFMAQQMVRNLAALQNVSYGLFDFKGWTSRRIEVDKFCSALDIDPPDGKTVTEQLGKTIRELRRRARPTTLFFDTYEQAGEEAQGWLEGVVLPLMLSAPWLRVVILGQKVPAKSGTLWEAVTAQVTLRLPSPDDWHAYSRIHRHGIDREFVVKAHELASGRPSVLVQLFGPS